MGKERAYIFDGDGIWFPGQKENLSRTINKYLDEAKPPEPDGRIIALISPHAGYVCCGDVMAAGLKAAARHTYKRVICLGFSHYSSLTDISVPDADVYKTPLGTIPLDVEVCSALLQHRLFSSQERTHQSEHSNANQLPFLQVALGEFKLVPILVGHSLSKKDYREAADVIRPFIDEHTLIVTSSDFTHYGPGFGYTPFKTNVVEEIKKLDMGAVDQIIAKDFNGFRSYITRTGATICGRDSIGMLINLLPENSKGKLLKYSAYGEVENRRVSYVSLAFISPTPSQTTAKSEKALHETPPEKKVPATKTQVDHPSKESLAEGELTRDEQRTLLKISRETLTQLVTKKGAPQIDVSQYDITPTLKKTRGIFVTLKKKNGDLRGCIGDVYGSQPLCEGVVEITEKSAFHDPRFSRVRVEEIDAITIEISVMSPLKKISSPDEIIVGKHGLVIRKEFSSGLLLPQVPIEWNWDRDEYLKAICRKAGLAADAWKSGAQLFIFTAQVFGEE